MLWETIWQWFTINDGKYMMHNLQLGREGVFCGGVLGMRSF